MPLAVSTVTVAAVSMVVLGTIFGIGLVLAARAFSTDEDPRVEETLDILPGINCGACNYAGCRGYAEAVVQEGEKVNLCLPGGPKVAHQLADLMDVELGETVRQRAVVHCQGGKSRCPDRFNYVGEPDCHAAHLTAGGPKACVYGCLGFGSCADACPFDAITMNEERLPVIDPDKCTACGICVKTCPRDLISLLPVQYEIYLGCSSNDRGKSVSKVCSVGCIACRRCVKEDPHDAIEMDGNLPVLDYGKADGDFSEAAEVCPMDCFVIEGPPEPAPRAEPAEQAAG